MSEEKLTLGAYFRQEREKKGIDLKEIEERTKISAQTLIFLEEDQLDMLPPRTFLRGFLRVISKEFHFDEDELLAHLEETLTDHEQKKHKLARDVAKGSRSSFPPVIIVIAVVVIVAILFVVTFKGCDQFRRTDDKTSSLKVDYAYSEPAETTSPSS
jgi:cytoskeletal protein RodZ